MSVAGDGINPKRVSSYGHQSIVHLCLLLRNSDSGYGSMAPPTALHGGNVQVVSGYSVEAKTVLLCVPPGLVAAIASYIVRSVDNQDREFTWVGSHLARVT